MITIQELESMKLHESKKSNNNSLTIFRVPNGWIYLWDSGRYATSVFDPQVIKKEYKTGPH